VHYDFNVADRAEVGKFTSFIENVEIQGLKINSFGYANKFWRGISLNFCSNVRIVDAFLIGSRDVNGSDIDGAGAISIRNAYDVIIDRARANEIGWYGVSLSGASQRITITNCIFEKCRHSTSLVWQSADFNYGEPHEILISNSTSSNSTLSGFEAHDTGRDVTYINCQSFDSGDNGFQIRNDGVTKLIHCSALRSKYDGLKVVSGTSGKRIQSVYVHGGEFAHNKRYGINSDAEMCLIDQVDFHDNANSAISAAGAVVTNSSFNRNGANNGAITYGLSTNVPVTDFTVSGNRFYYDPTRQPYIAQAKGSYPEPDRFKNMQLINNLFSGYAGVALVYALNTGLVPHPYMENNHFDTNYASHRGLATLIAGTATVNSSYVYVLDNGSYRATNPKIKLTVTNPKGTRGALYIDKVAPGTFTIKSTSFADISTVLWEITY